MSAATIAAAVGEARREGRRNAKDEKAEPHAVRQVIDAAEEIEMPDPEPLIAPDEESCPYPLDALPPTIQDAVSAYQSFGQQPVALVASSALSGAALATQGLVNVGRDKNLIGPISLNLIVIAESGERKTSADRRMRLSAQQWQQEFRDSHVAEIAEADSRIAAWQAERDGILSKIKSASGRKPKSRLSIVELKAALAQLETHKPHTAIMPTLFYEDVTPEALAQEIAVGWPSAALWSDEGALVVGSHGMSDDSALRYFGLLNRFWDGNSFERFRTTAKSFTVTGRRLTLSLMMQHVVLCRFIGAAGGVARGVGFLARFLPAWPHSTMGTRFYREADLDAPSLAKWDAKIKELLSLPLPADETTMALNPPTIFLSHRARNHFIEFHNDAERELGRTGQFAEVADFAAKAAENAVRLAAIFWVIEQGPSGEINAETMQAAAAVGTWHLHEAKRIVGASKIPQAVADATLLIEWMQKLGPSGAPRWQVSPREILHEGPARLRDKKRRDQAVELLLRTNHLLAIEEASSTLWILNPKLRGESNGLGT
jgi:hypothetical protein